MLKKICFCKSELKILEASDDKEEVTFKCTQIENVTWPDPILKTPVSRSTVKTTKEKFYIQLKRYCDNPSAFRSSIVTTSSTQRVQAKKLYNPIELSE